METERNRTRPRRKANSPLWRGGGKISRIGPTRTTRKKSTARCIARALPQSFRNWCVKIGSRYREARGRSAEDKALRAEDEGPGSTGTVLIVTEKLDENLYLSSRNLPNVLVLETREVDPVSLVRFNHVLLTQGGRDAIRGDAGMNINSTTAPAVPAERLMTVLLAPVVSEKGTFHRRQVRAGDLPGMPNATKPEVKAAVEAMFKVEVESVQIANVERQGEALRYVHGPAPELEEGVRLPEARPGNQLRGGELTCHCKKSNPPRPDGARWSRSSTRTCTRGGRSMRWRAPEARLGPQQPRPHHDPPQGRRPQAAVPDRRFQAQQGRHPAKVERLEYDPNRSANIALLCYVDGERRYIIAPRGVDGRHAAHVRARKRRSSRATACRCATSRSARRSTASR